jgi:hypothetical protein
MVPCSLVDEYQCIGGTVAFIIRDGDSRFHQHIGTMQYLCQEDCGWTLTALKMSVFRKNIFVTIERLMFNPL